MTPLMRKKRRFYEAIKTVCILEIGMNLKFTMLFKPEHRWHPLSDLNFPQILGRGC
jgi:hypothetical protein